MAAGCRCLVLTSRSGTLPLEVLQEFASAGVAVFTIGADSGNAKDSAAVLQWAHEYLPSMQHYAHAAGVSGFAMLDSLSDADFWQIAKPKVGKIIRSLYFIRHSKLSNSRVLCVRCEVETIKAHLKNFI